MTEHLGAGMTAVASPGTFMIAASGAKAAPLRL